jgi:hypothetical protein
MNPGASDAPVIPGSRNGKLRAILVAVLAIAVALILLGTLISLQEKWIVRTVRTEDQSTSLVDMAVDGFDRIHVLYNNDYGVTYKILDGSFKYDVSSPGGVVGLALDVDGMGKAHFAIVAPTVDPNQFYVGYFSYGNYGVGESELIDYNITPFAPSIAVDQSGYVHVTYSKQGDLMYATNLGGVWSKSVILSSTTHYSPYYNDYHTIVGVDSKDIVGICYSQYYNTVGYVSNASGVWVNEYLYDRGDRGGDSFDLAIDSDDHVHICFNGIINSTIGPGIVYGYNSGSGWTLETVAKTDGVDFVNCSIDVDRTGSPRIAYRSPVLPGSEHSGYHLKYIEKTDGSWHQAEVASVGQQMGSCHLAVNDEDIPYIAFPEGGMFKYATTSLTLSELAVAAIPGVLLAAVVAAMCSIIIWRIK